MAGTDSEPVWKGLRPRATGPMGGGFPLRGGTRARDSGGRVQEVSLSSRDCPISRLANRLCVCFNDLREIGDRRGLPSESRTSSAGSAKGSLTGSALAA